MPFAAKSAAPQVLHSPLALAALEQAADDHVTLFTARTGYLPADSLAAVLHARRKTALWLRLGPEDLARMHGTDERISVEGYEEAVRLYRRLIVNVAGIGG